METCARSSSSSSSLASQNKTPRRLQHPSNLPLSRRASTSPFFFLAKNAPLLSPLEKQASPLVSNLYKPRGHHPRHRASPSPSPGVEVVEPQPFRVLVLAHGQLPLRAFRGLHLSEESVVSELSFLCIQYVHSREEGMRERQDPEKREKKCGA